MSYSKIDRSTASVPVNTKYHLFAFVKDTTDGPGHVSISSVKETPEQNKIKHTSFFPSLIGSFINGLSLGSVPVPGRLASDHQEDLREAEHVLVKEIDSEQYQRAKKAQKNFSKEVSAGKRAYSVFGSLNPFATLMTSFFNAQKNAYATAEKHKRIHGFHPVEDHCGFHVYDNESHSAPATFGPDNCASSVTYVVAEAGIPFSNPLIPTLFTPSLEKQGFQKIDKEEFIQRFKLK
ncbi:Uncharacterised protein [Legionella donaldsonii]|uniref:Uncharacterized protein n=1 Tax=Legionella donaldsonii TaxID=45060 RepID=A0A378J8A6_9GAMM|nr:hypothetical protein [Legionella donaldsonii]STX43835.1 Uncharacterised protein [Legionella donaldsonii]